MEIVDVSNIETLSLSDNIDKREGHMSTTGKTKDPLGPIDFIVTLALRLFCVVLLFVAIASVVSVFDGGHPSMTLGVWGDPHPCLQVPQNGLQVGTSGNAGPIGGTSVQGLKSGVYLGAPHTYTICVDHLSGTDRTLFSVPVLIDLLWSLGFLWLTLRVIRQARQRGLFTHDVARATTHLGWYILGGWAIVNLTGGVLRAIAVSHLATGYSLTSGVLANMSWSWPIVIAGFGVISIGRVMQRTVPMREEIEATI
ncbi:hypothetical protein [Leekyejoonella antrihumi]|uniref:DUF2975 domain-containing protein n=1 Tax=Leekyejoonella antrihumi TaxID=1660198 RepID=A0A563DR96_9MICO|nr:hypothetical protein [Leekyejoonella antrihumi]TWP32750.1 hypothetical protein FGL98_23440 [Leekyejoonella antrihumi]